MKNEVLDIKDELIDILVKQRNDAHNNIAELEAKIQMLNKKIEEFEVNTLMDDLFKTRESA